MTTQKSDIVTLGAKGNKTSKRPLSEEPEMEELKRMIRDGELNPERMLNELWHQQGITKKAGNAGGKDSVAMESTQKHPDEYDEHVKDIVYKHLDLIKSFSSAFDNLPFDSGLGNKALHTIIEVFGALAERGQAELSEIFAFCDDKIGTLKVVRTNCPPDELLRAELDTTWVGKKREREEAKARHLRRMRGDNHD